MPRKKSPMKKKHSEKDALKRAGIFTSVEGAGSLWKRQKRKPGFLKGHVAVLRTDVNPYEYELNFIPGEADLTAADCPSLTEIQAMLGVVHQTLPKQFISSNQAEVFNALHDRYNVY